MDKLAARKMVKDTFERPFDKPRFTYFIKNLFQSIDQSRPFIYQGNTVPKAYQSYISSLERVGQYVDSDQKKIDTLIVRLKKETSLERARTMQRNFIAWYLNGSRDYKDAAVVAFLSPDEDDWRFSLVKMEYNLDEKGKPIPELTPARRWSFLVGAQENSHTAQSQLEKVLENKDGLTLTRLEDAFNVEVVTREFFNQYRELFHDLDDALERLIANNEIVRKEFSNKHVDPVSFSKKLLGQIVFLYFLQKKGWLGVPNNKNWGEGDKRFLRSLFNQSAAKKENFFNNYLEYLFYESLARQDRGTADLAYYPRFNCKIPFLNGGLFDPISEYDWIRVDLMLPNELFSNRKGESDEGSGILDIFDLYNFTVREDEPLEREVAIDPEMLGKVFENLLEVKDRKSKGTYYTPREIVHYMCQESLINYLDIALNTGDVTLVAEKPTNLKLFGAPAFQQQALKTSGNTNRVQRQDIEFLIRKGELAVQNDEHAQEHGETNTYTFKMPEGVRENADLIDEKLRIIRVCDPAIGSGAFPVGMMTEIVRARNALTTFLSKNGRSHYNFKREAIQNCLYGVDIDPGAVEIAKLRLWLSLVVDEENINNIEPLPNLDYKIVRGNSLLGLKPGLENWRLLDEMEKLKDLHFREFHPDTKQDYRRQIDALITQLATDSSSFAFQVYFSEVFHEKGGFDVVIANPPYVSHDKLESKDYLKRHFSAFEPFADLYCYFMELAVDLQNPNGVLCFITSNSYIKARYGAPLRSVLKRRTALIELIDIEDYQVFEAAIVNTAVVLARRGSHADAQCIVVNAKHEEMEFSEFVLRNIQYYAQSDFVAEPWSLTSREILQIIRRIEAAGKTLEDRHVKIRLGIATGANDAFLLDEETKSHLIQKDPRNRQIIKPVLRGRDIYRYGYCLDNQYVLLTKNGIDVRRDFPTIYAYLEKFGDEFKNRGAQGNHWTNLRNCAFYDDFKKEKIVWIELTDEARFALCDEEVYLLNSAYFLLPPLQFPAKYLLGILNSRLIQFYLSMIAQTSGMGVTRWINEYVKKFPVPEANNPISDRIIEKVTKILGITKDTDYLQNHFKRASVKELEGQIDLLVYELYGLKAEEIAIVEGKINT